MKTLKQANYHNIEIDNSEPDVIQIVGLGEGDSQIVFVERQNIKKLISIIRYGSMTSREIENQRKKWREAQRVNRKGGYKFF